MKIEDNRPNKSVEFSKIQKGETFKLEVSDAFYMRAGWCAYGESEDMKANAVSLRDGDYRHFNDNDLVIRVNAKVVIG